MSTDELSTKTVDNFVETGFASRSRPLPRLIQVKLTKNCSNEHIEIKNNNLQIFTKC